MSDNSRPSPVVSRASLAALYACFFVSGAAGLVYEVLWAKYLALYVGSTGLAQVIVLATFMGGLALGSEVLGRWADRAANPLKFYAFLEFGIGLYAILFDQIFVLGRAVFLGSVAVLGINPGGLILGKIAACVLSILVPTFLMGGTLPAMGRFLVRSLSGVGPQIARLYFLNSLGAVFGCLLAGFYLIQTFGLQFSMIVGAALNILVGLAALIVFGREWTGAPPPPPPAEPVPADLALPRWAAFVILGCIALSGAVSMLYEVAWIRLLALVLGTSTYAFSLMLATFILGLALGSFLLAFRKKTTGYLVIFGLAEAAVGLAVLLSLPFYTRLPFVFNQLATSLNREPATFGLYQFCTFALCALVMIVPTILQGITLPAAIKVVTADVRRLGRRVGFVYAINTVGTLVGSVAAGFVLLPWLGLKGTLLLAVALNLAMGLAILAAEVNPARRRRLVAGTALAALAAAGVYFVMMGPWDQQVLASGAYRTRKRIPSFASLQQEVAKRQLLFYRDGIDATIAIEDVRDPQPERLLTINGKVDASTAQDMATQKLMAHLPLLLHPRPLRVLIVGVGSGATIGSVLAYREVAEVDVVEISRDVILASRLFDKVNGSYWQDPRVKVYWEDAKTFLQITRKQYDVIISEPTNPWIAGVAGVFSKEYFESCRNRLADGGFFVQWIQAYELEDTTFYLMLETFTSVYPYYTLWNPTRSDTMLIGAACAYRPDFTQMEARLAAAPVKADLALTGASCLLTVLSLQMADFAQAPAHIPWLHAVHSDFFPILEYRAPRGFFIGSEAGGVKALDGRARAPANARLWVHDYLKDRAPTAADLRNAARFTEYYPCLFDRAALTWAREWAARYPDDAGARLLLGKLAPPARAATIAELAPAAAGTNAIAFDAAKLQCKLAFADYLDARNGLRDAGAADLLARVGGVRERFPARRDGDLLLWTGQLQYDLGQYSAAATSLYRAAQAFHQEGRTKEVVDAGCLLCESLLAQNRVREALQAQDNLLRSYMDELRVWLLKSRITAALFEQP